MALGNSFARPAIILLSGLPGAGKTTFARALLEQIRAVHVESDAIRRRLAARPAYTGRENAAVFARAESLARTALARGESVIVDATNLTTRDRRRFVRLSLGYPANLVTVRVTAPDAVIRERLSHPRDGYSQATIEVYEQMRSRPRPFPTPVVVVDTRFPLGPSLALVTALANAC